MAYKIVRNFRDRKSITIARGLTYEAVIAHCSDPETASHSCTEPERILLTQKKGPWFDCWYKEGSGGTS